MKKLSKVLISLLIILISMSATALAEEPIKVSVNGNIINFDNPPVIKEGRTLVPLRKIFEALDVTVRWDDTTKTVFAFKENTVISIPLNSKTATIQTDANASKSVELDVPAQLIESRTFVPVRFIAESIGADVNWDGATRTVVVTMEIKKNIQRIEYESGYYEGEIKDNNFNGYGKFVWNTGDVYEGYWLNGVKHGQGKYIWTSGDVYEGYWLNGVKHGEAKLTWSNGDVFTGEYRDGVMYKGKVTKANGEIINIDNGAPVENSSTNQGNSEFRQKAMNGPSYEELMKNSTKHIDTPDYFEGTVIQAIEENDGSSLFLVDISSFANSFVDMYNQFSDDPNLIDNVETQIIAVFSDESVDILQDDYIKVYGKVMEKFSYNDAYGISYTVPAIKLVEFERNKRSSEYIDEIYNGEHKSLDEIFRGE